MDHVPAAPRARSTRPLSSRRTRRAGGAGMGFLCAGSVAGGPGRWGRCWPFLRSRATSNQTTSDVVIASERADHRPRRGLTSFVFACFDSRVRDVPRGIRYVIGRVRVGFIPHGPFGDLTPYRTMRECKVYSAGPRSARSSGRDSGLEGAPSFANLLSGQISLVQVIH